MSARIPRKGRDGVDHQPAPAAFLPRSPRPARHDRGGGDDTVAPRRRARSSCAMAGPWTAAAALSCTAATYRVESSMAVTEEVCLTATVDILRAMSNGTGPQPRAHGAWLFRLGCRAARKRDRAEWLADLPGPVPTCSLAPTSTTPMIVSWLRWASIRCFYPAMPVTPERRATAPSRDR